MGQVEALLALDREPLRFEELPARLTDIRDGLASFGIGSYELASSINRWLDEAHACDGDSKARVHIPESA
ncbi:MAG TPA: hypothetical protein VLI21_09225 [Casimicrobiaceae bacterium]|nr:hypothetical protein [Casimicrobiaceae bacterium]